MDLKEELFRENYLFTREDILKSLELFIEHVRLNEENEYSNEVVKNRVKLCEKFIAAVKKCKLPVLTELWWFYVALLLAALPGSNENNYPGCPLGLLKSQPAPHSSLTWNREFRTAKSGLPVFMQR